MPENFLNNWNSYIKPQWKTAFFAAVIIGFLTHMYVFTNALPNHDGMINIYSEQRKYYLGRFFLSPLSGISSYFDLPWINGTLSIFYLALTTALLTELFELRKKISIIMTAGLIVTFPTISSTFSYMFTADGYMAGSLLTVLALLLAKKYKYGFLPGAILFYLSVGIYQANLPFLLTLVTVLLISDILGSRMAWKGLFVSIFRYFAVTVIGMVCYAVHFSVYRAYFAPSASTNYQGLDKVGSNSASPLEIVQKINEAATNFFFRGFSTDTPVNLFEILNVGILGLIIIGAALLTIQNQFQNKWMTGIAVILLASLPYTAYSLYFVSPGVTYHMLMVLSIVSFYLLPVLFYDRLPSARMASKSFSWSTVLLTSLLVFNFAIIANISYFNLNLKYERSYGLANRIIDRIEQTEGFENATKLAIYGRADLNADLSTKVIPETIPEMTGATGVRFLAQPYHYTLMMENFFGVEFGLVSQEQHEAIEASEQYAEMKTWPAPSSIAIVEDTVIMKLSE